MHTQRCNGPITTSARCMKVSSTQTTSNATHSGARCATGAPGRQIQHQAQACSAHCSGGYSRPLVHNITYDPTTSAPVTAHLGGNWSWISRLICVLHVCRCDGVAVYSVYDGEHGAVQATCVQDRKFVNE